MENKANQQQQKKQQQSQLNLSDLLAFAWRLRWWMAGGAVIALILAFAYVRMQTPVYQRQAWVMLNTNDGSNADMALLSEFTGRTMSKKIDNELFILQSPSLMKRVVEQYGLNTRYFEYRMPVADRLEWNWFAKKRVELYRNAPIELTLAVDSLYPSQMRPGSIVLSIENQKNEGFKIEKLAVNGQKVDFEKKTYKYGEQLPIAGVVARIELLDASEMRQQGQYDITWTTPIVAARGFVRNLSTEVIGQKMAVNNIAKLYYKDAIPQRADDILNALVETTNLVGKEYKNKAIISTIEFIDQRIEALNQDLGTAETNFKQYQSSNTVVDLKSQSTAAISQDAQYKNQLTEVKLQQRVLEMIQDYIKQQPEGVYEVIPTNIGISDAGLTAILNTYNTAVSERNRMVAYSSETNPRVVSLNSQLEDGKKAIDLSIENLVRVYNIREKELERTLSDSRRQMANLPQQQFEVQQLSRQINIIEPLYLLLQQKREESQIAMYSQTDIFRLVEPAFGGGAPISPNGKKIYLMALLIGLCLVPGLVFLRMYLRTKVETKADLEGKVDATVMAVIPTVKDGKPKLIKEIGRDVTSESFRMLRSNLQYLSGVKVIQVTSSTPGEGKSYIAANLAISIAHTGKKVMLLGLDLRKPVLPQLFPDVAFDKNHSIVSYMIDGCSLDDIVLHTDVEGLDIAMSGIIPPNPTELLSQGKEGEIIEKLRDQYDYIIVDSAPYLPVSDSFLINAFVDATLYVVRSGYTDLKMLPEINQAIHSEAKPMKRVSLVLNDLDLDDAKYRYGYGAGYGYGSGSGYGYGYGYGYGAGYDDSTTEKKSRFHRKSKA